MEIVLQKKKACMPRVLASHFLSVKVDNPETVFKEISISESHPEGLFMRPLLIPAPCILRNHSKYLKQRKFKAGYWLLR